MNQAGPGNSRTSRIDPAPRNYSGARHLWEEALGLLSLGGWPARAARALGFQRTLGVTEYTVATSQLPAQAPPLRIAFAADFHAGPVTHPQLLENACETLASLDADLLLLGGDFVSHRWQNVNGLARLLAQIPARLGRFAVLGNHDYWAGARHLADRLELEGLPVLVNRNVQLPPPYEHIAICGLDDHSAGHPDASAAFAGAAGARILLMHAPSGLLDVKDHAFDLALCGHTHGGQIVTPRGFPLYVPHGQLSRQFVYGRYRLPRTVRDAELIVTRGVGCSTVPVRMFAQSEIIVCTLETTPRSTAEAMR